MEPIDYVFGFQIIGGLIGHVPLLAPLGFRSADKTIDHSTASWRRFYRLMAFLMCNLWSFFLTMSLLGALPVAHLLDGIKHSSDLVQAVAALLIPLPMTPLLLIGYAKFARLLARMQDAR